MDRICQKAQFVFLENLVAACEPFKDTHPFSQSKTTQPADMDGSCLADSFCSHLSSLNMHICHSCLKESGQLGFAEKTCGDTFFVMDRGMNLGEAFENAILPIQWKHQTLLKG